MSVVTECGGVRYRVPSGPMMKGEFVWGHTHNFVHGTKIEQGRFRIEGWRGELINQYDDHGNIISQEVIGDKVYDQEHGPKRHDSGMPYIIEILADVIHKITALEDGSIYMCLYASRDPETGEVLNYWNGWEAASY